MISLIRTKNVDNLRLAKFISKTLPAGDKMKLASYLAKESYTSLGQEILLEEKVDFMREDLTRKNG